MTNDILFESFWKNFLGYIQKGYKPIGIKADLNGICTLYAKNSDKEGGNIAYFKGDFLSVDIAMDCEKYLEAKYFENERKQNEN